MRKDKIETNEYSELVFRFRARKGIGAVAYILILLAFCVAFGAIQGACFIFATRLFGGPVPSYLVAIPLTAFTWLVTQQLIEAVARQLR